MDRVPPSTPTMNATFAAALGPIFERAFADAGAFLAAGGRVENPRPRRRRSPTPEST